MASWPDQDLIFHDALMNVINEATLELKGKDVVSFSKVYIWAKNLPNNYEKKPEPRPKRSKFSKGPKK